MPHKKSHSLPRRPVKSRKVRSRPEGLVVRLAEYREDRDKFDRESAGRPVVVVDDSDNVLFVQLFGSGLSHAERAKIGKKLDREERETIVAARKAREKTRDVDKAHAIA